MRRHGNLFQQLTSFENIYLATRKARKSKRFRPDVLEFHGALEENIILIQSVLRSKTYTPGAYRTFVIHEPKKREISRAPYFDRVIHHVLVNVIEPLFERKFIFHSYANRKARGTHRAVKHYARLAATNRYVLKCDIRKCFPSIDHAVLKAVIRKTIKDRDVLWLIDAIIDAANPQEAVLDYFPGDSLFSPADRRKGLPIGNLTSQFFANVFLNELDHFVKEKLRARHYIRYVDDFVVLDNDRDRLWAYRSAIETFLESLRLRFNSRKVFISPASPGIKFLGYRVYPSRVELGGQNIRRFLARVKRLRRAVRDGRVSRETMVQSVASFRGYAGLATSQKIMSAVLRRSLER